MCSGRAGRLASSELIRDNKWVTKVQELDHVLVLALRAAAVEKESAVAPAQLDTSVEGSLDSDDEGAVTPFNVSVTEHSSPLATVVQSPASPSIAVDETRDSEDDDDHL